MLRGKTSEGLTCLSIHTGASPELTPPPHKEVRSPLSVLIGAFHYLLTKHVLSDVQGTVPNSRCKRRDGDKCATRSLSCTSKSDSIINVIS